MALTEQQLRDMHADLGISHDQKVFTTNELNRLYERAGNDYNTAVYLGYRQLLAQANKFHDYTAGMTKIQRKQMRDNIKDTMEFWQEESRGAANQMRIVGMLEIPPRDKEEPAV